MSDAILANATKPRDYDKLFKPKSVAIIGASPKRGTIRNTLVRMVLENGFKGDVFPVSLSAAEIEGCKAYTDVSSIPGVPDVALIITPAESVPEVLEECGKKGIGAAIVLSSGFEEVEGGKVLAEQLRKIALEYGITLLGPNCQGPWSVRERAILTYSSAAAAMETIRHDPVAIVSHSGALGGALAGALYRNGIGCSYNIALGNETVTDLLDILGWVIEQDDVRVIALYIEGLTDGHRLVPIAARAAEKGIRLVAVKAGRTEAGQAATASHTGKIASSDAVYSGVFQQAGVLAVESLAELLAAIETFAFLPNPRTASDSDKAGVSIVSSSGGAAALLADHSGMMCVPLAEFESSTRTKLKKIVPDFGSVANPIDLTGQARTVASMFRDACLTISQDANTEALIVQFASSGKQDVLSNVEVFEKCASSAGIPVVLSLVADTVDVALKERLRKSGVLVVSDTKAAMQSIQWLYDRRALGALPAHCDWVPTAEVSAPEGWPELMAYLSDCGIKPAPWTILEPGQSAAAACADLVYPLVVKVLPDETDHKTELGLVKLRVQTPEEVDRHAADFREKLNKPDLQVLVQEMINDGVEVVLSCLRNPDFGPILSIGSGGVAVELYKDIIHMALPVTPEQVATALKGLKLSTLLGGFRGKPKADIESLAKAAAEFGNRFMAAPAISEFEINPILVRPAGDGVLAVDALVVVN